jgi:Putative transposase
MAGNVVRAPLSLKRLVYFDGQQAVIYHALTPNPSLGRNVESMDPLEWLARMTDHIPDRGEHRTLFYGHRANWVRGERTAQEPGEGKVEEQPAKKRRCSPNWARLISTVFQADHLTCRKCGGKLKVILGPPQEKRPPPPDIRYVPVDEGQDVVPTDRHGRVRFRERRQRRPCWRETEMG